MNFDDLELDFHLGYSWSGEFPGWLVVGNFTTFVRLERELGEAVIEIK